MQQHDILKRLRALRMARGMTQEELEKRSGVHRVQISQYERGCGATLKTAVQLADALGVTLDELVGR